MYQKLVKWFVRLLVVSLFMVLLAVILLTANGFSYDFKVHDIRKTSVIYLDNQIENVDVYLDDELVAENLPEKVPNISPGEYQILVKKTGYYDWREPVDVKVDFVKRINNILLVPGNLSDFAVAVKVGTDLNLEKFKTGKEPEQADDQQFKQADGYYFSYDQNHLFLLDRSKQKLILSKNFDQQSIEKIKYQAVESQGFFNVYLSGESGFRSYSLENEKFVLIAKNVQGEMLYNKVFGWLIMTDDGTVWLLDQQKNKSMIGRLSGQNQLLGWYGKYGHFIFKNAQGYFLTDLEFKQFFPLQNSDQKIEQLMAIDDWIYYLSDQQMSKINLLSAF
jgi:hypothetical protein